MDQPEKKKPHQDPAATTSHKVQADDTSMSRRSGSTVGGEVGGERLLVAEDEHVAGECFGIAVNGKNPTVFRSAAYRVLDAQAK
jgi:hypothetical protein